MMQFPALTVVSLQRVNIMKQQADHQLIPCLHRYIAFDEKTRADLSNGEAH